ncbi:succinate dehydrogenase cytochrome b subunit [Trueperella bialowiezensis]|uniref:Succinate dehydrogenase (Or fumarate reductase) cytochrome b subunit, b558 family n=1 Tax=Trueperella bialowiezensis TaxID=312285 RepID=A0A448PFS4_9ACTO|nr:succinate dehydrogenase cytochrome b subunit [Trueperella bialowiezensis]VEI13811.1 succinate dehydrogenase (or fumarate reductase) cytochrome b subunit, b558 family [Trueperella bialowiezensis]
MKLKAPPSWALKVTMAITGSIWGIFVLIHLYGNLKVYQGAEKFDGYAFWLRHAFEPFFPEAGVLWIMRIVLVIALVLHVGAATILYFRGRRFRGPHRAKKYRNGLQAVSARLMPLTGVLILAFIIIHILDLTVGVQPIATDQFQGPTATESTAYSNLVASFSRPLVAAFYSLMMVFLAIHLAHGAKNIAVDLGAMGKRLRAGFVIVGAVAAIAILIGNASIPIAVQMGWIS